MIINLNKTKLFLLIYRLQFLEYMYLQRLGCINLFAMTNTLRFLMFVFSSKQTVIERENVTKLLNGKSISDKTFIVVLKHGCSYLTLAADLHSKIINCLLFFLKNDD
mgnify:FL=1